MKILSYLQERVNCKLGLSNRFLFKDLKNKYTLSFNLFSRSFCIPNNKKKVVGENIHFFIKIRTFRGLRHKSSYPVRGQRTHTNAKTSKR
jgi:small subunit ribosomal protein S13